MFERRISREFSAPNHTIMRLSVYWLFAVFASGSSAFIVIQPALHSQALAFGAARRACTWSMSMSENSEQGDKPTAAGDAPANTDGALSPVIILVVFVISFLVGDSSSLMPVGKLF